jgi:hypothetical protein
MTVRKTATSRLGRERQMSGFRPSKNASRHGLIGLLLTHGKFIHLG